MILLSLSFHSSSFLLELPVRINNTFTPLSFISDFKYFKYDSSSMEISIAKLMSIIQTFALNRCYISVDSTMQWPKLPSTNYKALLYLQLAFYSLDNYMPWRPNFWAISFNYFVPSILCLDPFFISTVKWWLFLLTPHPCDPLNANWRVLR